ncbi:NAD(P)/FAD-dependent oxidoreductase [Pseudorhodoferax sp. Leaf265]|uniref:NAD(P)/FAD-dependent oxidoreductase n=1 Tax=Pseudorhodoferax sp. Leaf265 TaxID=1736315 RepID=UPI0007016BC1|nr:NAD(P)/FAD-dependent oxidoreductase [Pseudorhodoferax sp. Leaf265]KQP20413.1 pyridine nucleotide-disulfide oxidoreductase [Pseudorhodoferax sp. Leaf265]
MTPAHDAPKPARIRLLGAPHSVQAFEIRDFLSRSGVAYDWLELDGAASQALAGVQPVDSARLPVCEFPDGTRIDAATVPAVAARLGWITTPRLATYDVSIYGAGPAGLSAAVYAASEGLKTVLVERQAIGGQAGSSSLIENYLGFPQGVSGAELAERARQQAARFGVDILQLREGVYATFRDDGIHVDMADGSHLAARVNICATGIEWRRLRLENEDRLLGAGVFYGAGASEAPMCQGETVYVVGGGNSAGQAAMHFSAYAHAVVMLVRGNSLADTLSDYLVRKIAATANVRVVTHCEVAALQGEGSLQAITVRDRQTGKEETLPTRHLFVCIGGLPNTDWARDTPIARDSAGYLLTGADVLAAATPASPWPLQRPPYHLETSVPGSFAIGDVRHGSIKRVATAVGEGAMAVAFVHQYLHQA